MIIKVQHKKCPYLFVDVFPFDIYGKAMTNDEQLQKTEFIKTIISDIKKSTSFSMSGNEIQTLQKEIMQTKILQKDIPDDRTQTDVVWGIDFHHRWRNWFTNYNVIFPTKKVNFEGFEFDTMNNPDAFLSRLYGDYMAYPNKIGYGHSAYVKLSPQDKLVIDKLKESVENDKRG